MNIWTIQPITSPIVANTCGLTATYMMTINNTAKAANVIASVVISLNIFNVLASYCDWYMTTSLSVSELLVVKALAFTLLCIMLVSAALRLASLGKLQGKRKASHSLRSFLIFNCLRNINLHSCVWRIVMCVYDNVITIILTCRVSTKVLTYRNSLRS